METETVGSMSVADELALAERAAEAALRSRGGRTPDQVIERELRAAGVAGSYSTSRPFRRLWHRSAARYAELKKERRVPAQEITARVLWAAYDRGLSQRQIGRRIGIDGGVVSSRSIELGFVLMRDPADGLRYVVESGPCLDCGALHPVEMLDEDRLCAACAPALLPVF